MAFTKSPTEDTYSSQRIKLSRELSARDGGTSGRDEDLFNVFLEPVKQKTTGDNRHFITKRSGTTQSIASVAGGTVRGIFFWEDQYKLYYCVGNDIYTFHTQTGVQTTIANPFGTTVGDVGFCLFQFAIGVTKVVATDGTTLISIEANDTVAVCVDGDMPVHLPYPVYLDGYIFVAKVGTGDIYNSNLDDPLAWTPGDFITAEMEGDNLVRLIKINNYIVAFGTSSIEYFWDAAIATGSPLQRNDTPIKLNSYLAGFAQFGNSIFYIGVNEGGQPDVYRLKDFKIDELGTPTISRYLNQIEDNTTTWRGGIVSCKGHTFYVMNVGTTATYVLDVDSGIWTKWGWQATAVFNLHLSIGITNFSNAYTYFALGSNDTIYRFQDALYQDNGTNFPVIMTTEAENFGTMNRKSMSKLSIIGDRSSGSMSVQWSDDDGQTYNTARSILLNQDHPCDYRLGSFRQRSFKFTYSANDSFRIQDVEVVINKGRA